MRKVMIATPCLYGDLSVWYVNSLVQTLKYNIENNKQIEIIPIWISFDALLQKARNDQIHSAIGMDADDIIWIDSDIEWKPEWFFKLLEYPVDVVGGTYRKKGDKEEYVYGKTNNLNKNNLGLLPVDSLGTGFVRMSKKAYTYLWNVSTPYLERKDNQERRMIFDIVIEEVDGTQCLISEDIHAFNKLKKGNFDIWLDPKITCGHTGQYKFEGNFDLWYNGGQPLPLHTITPPAIINKKNKKQL